MKKKIQIVLKSLDQKSLNFYILILKMIFNKINIKASLIKLPLKKKRLTVLKSPHVNKKAQEHFHLKISKVSINIIQVSSLINIYKIFINKPKHIFFQIKILRE